MSPLTKLPAVFRDKLVQSRFFTISATLHLILLAILATTIYYKIEPPAEEKGDFTSDKGIVQLPEPIPQRPKDLTTPPIPSIPFTPPPGAPAAPGAPDNPIITKGPSDYKVPDLGTGVTKGPQEPIPPGGGKIPEGPKNPGREVLQGIADTVGSWKRGTDTNRTYEFTAFLGRYQGGNWSSTVRVTNGEITGGSLPNLLYCTSKWTKDKIKTNERNVKAIDLSSDELFTVKPPFIFLTGTQDFKLTAKEVENLQKYIRLGGAIWGDSSVPGRRSAFDVAFCREMKRVIPDIDKEFTPLPANHAIFAQGYYKKLNALPTGVNQYREPVEVLRYFGEVAVIHTINDYGDMWQIGLDKNAQIDLSRNARGEYVAMNAALWDQRGLYVRNLEQPSVEEAYKFGINMIFHLLTRWDNRTSSIGTL